MSNDEIRKKIVASTTDDIRTGTEMNSLIRGKPIEEIIGERKPAERKLNTEEFRDAMEYKENNNVSWKVAVERILELRGKSKPNDGMNAFLRGNRIQPKEGDK